MRASQGYHVGSIVDARSPEFNTDGFGHTCAAHGWTYDRPLGATIHLPSEKLKICILNLFFCISYSDICY